MPSFIKDLQLKEVQGVVEKSGGALLLVDPSRLNSGDSIALRSKLRKVGARMKVAKVRLLKRAIPADAAKLLGGRSSVAVVTGEDLLGAAKVVEDLAKEQKVAFKGALFDGQVYDAAGAQRLATMPGKDQLRGMLVNVLAQPIIGFARVVDEIRKKQEGGGG